MSSPEVISSSEPVSQFSVSLPNRVGALMSLVKLLQDHHIDVIGFFTQDSVDLTLVRMLVTDPEGTQALFMERGIAFSTCHVVVVEIQEGDQGLVPCLAALQEAEINIRFSYPLLRGSGPWSRMALNVDDYLEAGAALLRAGFKTLSQSELSR